MSRALRVLAFIAIVPLLASGARADVSVYTDGLGPGWQDWSWGGISIDFSATTPRHSGTTSTGVTYTDGWSGLQLGAYAGVDISAFDVLRFYIHGGTTGGQQIEVRCGNGSGAYVSHAVTPTAATWTQIDVPLFDLGSPRQATYVYWFNNTAAAQSAFYIDDVSFLNSGMPTPTPLPPGIGPPLHVDVSQERRAIAPGIYGINFASEELASDLRLPVRRWGGNATTRYDWRTDTANHASDWYFENSPNDNPHPELLPDGSSSDRFVEQDRRTGTQTLLTVPLIGWAPKARGYACGFSVAKYGPQQATDAWQSDCGNGVRTDGSEITGNDPLDTSVAIDPSFVQGWMTHLIGKYGAADSGGVRFYALDNEPMLWPDTHRDVHPQPTSYDEVRDRTYAYAAAIKATDPGARTFGPTVWGWTAYFWSALDWAAGGDWWNHPQDRLAHGNVPFLAWYLQQMQAYEQAHGLRLLDYLDVHYYPQAAGVSLAPAGNATTQALRLRSTRSLWDASYTDESWIGVPVYLIPRLREWIDGNYPGTKLAINEYNWGALDHINGALAQADVLGIFAREGVDVAALWDPPSPSMPAAFAFRLYRNYDGSGGAFGETHVQAQSDDQEQLSVYAAQRDIDSALTVLVINKSATTLTTSIALTGFTPASTAQLYRYSAADLGAIVRQSDQAVSGSTLAGSFPAASINLFVLAAANVQPTPSITATATIAPCAPTPVPGCATAARGALRLNRPKDPSRSSLSWRWSQGTVSPGDFGNPLAATGYSFCVYDDGTLVLDRSVSPAGTCGSRGCWTTRGADDLAYKTRSANADGVTSIRLISGTGAAAIVLNARGPSLTLPLPMTQSTAVTVQLVTNGAAAAGCWESVLPAPAIHSDDSKFTDKVP